MSEHFEKVIKVAWPTYLEIVKYWPIEYRVAYELTEKYRQAWLKDNGLDPCRD